MQYLNEEIKLFEMARTLLRNYAVLDAEQKQLLLEVTGEVNRYLTFLPEAWGVDFSRVIGEDEGVFCPDAEKWVLQVERQFQHRLECRNHLDFMINNVYDFIVSHTRGEMFGYIKQNFYALDYEDARRIVGGYQRYHYFWGNLDPNIEDYDVIWKRIDVLQNNLENIKWLYEKLEDYRSRLVFVYILYHWITFDLNYLRHMREMNFLEYFDLDILGPLENETIIDCGTFDGDTILDYVRTYGENSYRKIYTYDILPSNVAAAQEKLKAFPNIVIKNAGVGAERGSIWIEDTGRVKGDTSILEEKELNQKWKKEIPIVVLDEDIKESVTMIKMDIEGAEQGALLGCREHITKEKPKLLICTYHNNSDIFEIPRRIFEMRDDYKFYMRCNGNQYMPSEYLIFAV